MTAASIIAELKKLGSDSIKKILMKHGAKEPFYGVKIEDLKKIQKRVKMNHKLATELFDSGIGDAQYLAGLIADPTQMTKKDLQHWADRATWQMVSEYAVAWTASESKHGRDMALKWIDAKNENIAATGWSTLASLVSVKDDAELDLDELTELLERVEKTIHQQPDRIRYVMNCFVIAVGSYVAPLTDLAIKTSERIGKVEVDMGDTACKVPFAPDYIRHVQKMGRIGKKRKTAKC